MKFLKHNWMALGWMLLVCSVAMGQTGLGNFEDNVKTANTQILDWVQTIIKIGGFMWCLIVIVKAWTGGRIMEAQTWYSVLGIAAGTILVGNISWLYDTFTGTTSTIVAPAAK